LADLLQSALLNISPPNQEAWCVSEASSPNLSLSLVVPAYNEVESLALLHEKIRAAVEPLNLAWEVIYVDDGSTDHSADVMCGLQRQDDHVVVAVLRRNSGKSLALDVGFSLARGQTIITMDADLQDEPAEIPRLLAKLDEGYDLVTGSAPTARAICGCTAICTVIFPCSRISTATA
jgi:glycosyltransferase involved in cell wall biosynthesis